MPKKSILFNATSEDVAAQKRIMKRNELGNMTAAIRFALAYTNAGQRELQVPPDYDAMSNEELITLVTHGGDWQIRRDALIHLIANVEAQK